ncbi:MAG: hypothetical protein WC700_04455 [Gemmatimonadaceae bacterium]
MSTILAVSAAGLLSLAERAGAQTDYEPNTLWLTAAVGSQRAVSISDKQSIGGWRLDTSRPITVALDWGSSRRTFGARLHRTVSPMTFEGWSCAGCEGEVQALSLMAAYRSSQQLGDTPIRQFIELGAGITRWSGLRGTRGDHLPPFSPVYDFTYAGAIGVGLPVTDRLSAILMYDILMARHVQEVIVYGGEPTPPDAKAAAWFGLASLRLGARYRVGN